MSIEKSVKRAQAHCDECVNDCGSDENGQNSLTDALCDLRHYADKHGLDFNEAVDSSLAPWGDEVEEAQVERECEESQK